MKPYAGFWQRTKAFAFDYVIIAVYLGLVTGLFVLINASTSAGQRLFADRALAQISAFVLVTLPITLYFSIGESSAKQATWGKQRLGLKVVDRNGDRVGFWRTFTRTLLKFIPWELSHTLIWEIIFSAGTFPTYINYGFALVYLLIGLNIASMVVTRTKQSLYDLLSGTFIVNQQEQ